MNLARACSETQFGRGLSVFSQRADEARRDTSADRPHAKFEDSLMRMAGRFGRERDEERVSSLADSPLGY